METLNGTTANILTADEIRNSKEREYNPQEWDKVINRYTKYDNVEFYVIPADEKLYQYDRYFVAYTLPEGIRLFKSVSYSSTITNGGFFRACITKLSNDFGWLPEGQVNILTNKIQGGAVANTPENREIMAKLSRERGDIFTKELI